jgi:hypothetical protein
MKISKKDLTIVFNEANTRTFMNMLMTRFRREKRHIFIAMITEALCREENPRTLDNFPTQIKDILAIDSEKRVQWIEENSWIKHGPDDRLEAYLEFIDFINEFYRELLSKHGYKM